MPRHSNHTVVDTDLVVNPKQAIVALAPLVRSEVQQQTARIVTQAVASIREKVIADTYEWLDQKGIPKAVRVATHEILKFNRKRGSNTYKRTTTEEPVSQRDLDPFVRAELKNREDVELFGLKVECVKEALTDGLSKTHICRQFSLDDDTWDRIQHAIGEGVH